jgi:hypothetical protein
MNRKYNLDDSDGTGAFIVLEIVLREYVQVKLGMHRVVVNFMRYHNI